MIPAEREMSKKIHSIRFYVYENDTSETTTEFNTYGDFHLIPSERPVIVPPPPKIVSVDVPGSKYGSIDQSTALTGDMLYGNREGSIVFFYENTYRYVTPTHIGEPGPFIAKPNGVTEQAKLSVRDTAYSYDATKDPHIKSSSSATYAAPPTGSRYFYKTGFMSWDEVYNALMEYIHGKRAKAVLLDSPDYYYTGLWYVESFKSGTNSPSEVQLKYKLDPYRLITADAKAAHPDWPTEKR